MNVCPHCGCELPEEAHFCPGCMRPVGEREPIRIAPARPRRRLLSLLALCAVLLCAAGWYVFRPEAPAPQTYEIAAASTRYGDYTIGLHSGTLPEGRGAPSFETYGMTLSVMEDDRMGFPVQLSILSETGATDKAAFMAQVSDIVWATDLPAGDGSVTENAEPPVSSYEDYPYTLDGRFYYAAGRRNGATSCNIIVTVSMNNGDVLRFTWPVSWTLTLRSVIRYDDPGVEIDTLEGLNALLASLDPDEGKTVYEVYLPPVEYTGTITLGDAGVLLYGYSGNADKQTTVRGSFFNPSSADPICEVWDLHFIGEGGTGLSSGVPMLVRSCSFEDFDTGILVQDGSWIAVNDSEFLNNGIGLRFDTMCRSIISSDFSGNFFGSNETALSIERVGGASTLRFTGCLFSGNGSDIVNPANAALDLADTQMGQ